MRPLLLLVPLVLGAWAVQSDRCTVRRITDGDTFACTDGRKIRPIGIDTPELAQGAPGSLARSALARLIPPGSTVRLELDVAPRDRYRRVLAYVWADSLLVNEAMVRGGWAVLYTVPPNVKYARRFERAQRLARERRAGLWASGGFACPPSAFRRRECRAAPPVQRPSER